VVAALDQLFADPGGAGDLRRVGVHGVQEAGQSAQHRPLGPLIKRGEPLGGQGLALHEPVADEPRLPVLVDDDVLEGGDGSGSVRARAPSRKSSVRSVSRAGATIAKRNTQVSSTAKAALSLPDPSTVTRTAGTAVAARISAPALSGQLMHTPKLGRATCPPPGSRRRKNSVWRSPSRPLPSTR